MYWIDLSAHNVHIRPQKLPSGLTVLVFEGDVSNFNVTELGFQANNNNVWFSTRYSLQNGGLKGFNVNEFKTVFPLAERRDMTVQEVMNGTNPVKNAEKENDAHKLQRDYQNLGLNPDNLTVYKDAIGRLIKEGDRIEREQNPEGVNPRFLRAGTRNYLDFEDVVACLRGFAREIIKGYQAGENDIINKYRVLTDTDKDALLTPSDYQNLYLIEDAIDVAISIELKDISYTTEDLSNWLKEVQQVDSRIPRLPVSYFGSPEKLERGFTPLLAAYVSTLTKHDNKSVLMPFAANGMASSFFDKAEQVTILTDENQQGIQSINKDIHGIKIQNETLSDVQIAPESTDIVVLAAPLDKGNNETYSFDDVEFSRSDFYETAKMMSGATMQGTSVVMLTGTKDDLSEPNNNKSINEFIEWASKYYHMQSILEIDPVLFNRQGEWRPAYIIHVGNRRWAPSSDMLTPDIIHISSHDNLVEYATKTPAFNEQAKAHANTISSMLSALNNEFDKADQITLNEFQRPYIPASGIGEASLALPKNLVVATRTAFNRHIRKHGTPEKEIMNILDVDDQELVSRLSSEQIDAAALAKASHKEGFGFLLGDQTGTGKGRSIGVNLYDNIKQGYTPIFVTKSTDLFSDLWRDLEDIGVADKVRPLVINISNIRDQQGRTIIEHNENAVEYLKNTHEVPDEYNAIFTTYKQLAYAHKLIKTNRRGHRSQIDPTPAQEKAFSVLQAASGQPVILDESHLATGEGAYNATAMYLLNNAKNQYFSSATSMRDPKALRLYASVFPKGVSSDELIRIARKGGAPLQEVLSQMLVSDGRMLRREHNLTGLTVDYQVDTRRTTRNEHYANLIAEYIKEVHNTRKSINVFRERIEDYIKNSNPDLYKKLYRINSTGTKFETETFGFTNVAHQIADQLVVALKQDEIADTAIQALKDGKKPLIAINHTGGTLHEEVLKKVKKGYNKENLFGEEGVIYQYPDVKDVLRRSTNRLFTIKLLELNEKNKNGIGTGKYNRTTKHFFDLLNDFNDHPDVHVIKQAEMRLQKIVEKFPDLPFAPLDYIRDRVEHAGYRIGEISGRSHQVTQTPKGPVLSPRMDKDAFTTRYGFNNGEIDAVLGTSSITTGNSMHASSRYNDTRQRVLIEGQLFPIVYDRIQLLGRVNRRDQVVKPEVKTISTGLPIEERIAAVSNENLRQMSASVTSNRQSAQAIKTFDLFNKEGDESIIRVIARNPDWMNIMDVTPGLMMELKERKAGELARRVTGLMILLNVNEQRKFLKQADAEYNAIMEETYGNLGADVSVGELNIKARDNRRIIYKGDSRSHYESEFDKPVELAEISYQENQATQMTPKELENAVKNAVSFEQMYIDNNGVPYGDYITKLENNHANYINKIAKRYNVDTDNPDLMDGNYSFYRMTLEDYEKVLFSVQNIKAGTIINTYFPKVVLGFTLPNEIDNNFDPLNFKLKYYDTFSGEVREDYLINIRLDKEKILPNTYTAKSETANKLLVLGKSKQQTSRVILRGNMFEATRLAVEEGMGRAVIYSDAKGARHRAIMLPASAKWTDMLKVNLPLSNFEEAAAYMIQTQIPLKTTKGYDPQKTIAISAKNNKVIMQFPKKVIETKNSTISAFIQRYSAQIESDTKIRDKITFSLKDGVEALRYTLDYCRDIYSTQNERSPVRLFSEQYQKGKLPKLADIINPNEELDDIDIKDITDQVLQKAMP